MPRLLEILEQAGDRLIQVLRVLGVLGHVTVLIPVVAGTAVHQFDEAHAAFRQATRHKTRPAEAVGLVALHAVERESVVTFLREIENLARLGLHVERGLEGADARGQFAVVAAAR